MKLDVEKIRMIRFGKKINEKPLNVKMYGFSIGSVIVRYLGVRLTIMEEMILKSE